MRKLIPLQKQRLNKGEKVNAAPLKFLKKKIDQVNDVNKVCAILIKQTNFTRLLKVLIEVNKFEQSKQSENN